VSRVPENPYNHAEIAESLMCFADKTDYPHLLARVLDMKIPASLDRLVLR